MGSFFVHLPVKDLAASKAFFGALGFTFNPQFTDDNATCMIVDENAFVMLLTEPRFSDFIKNPISDASRHTECLMGFSAESREQVDDILAKALAAGAKPWMPNQDYGEMMYGCSFQDLDGHVWECMWMSPQMAQGG